jgi:hypothetical protein
LLQQTKWKPALRLAFTNLRLLRLNGGNSQTKTLHTACLYSGMHAVVVVVVRPRRQFSKRRNVQLGTKVGRKAKKISCQKTLASFRDVKNRLLHAH